MMDSPPSSSSSRRSARASPGFSTGANSARLHTSNSTPNFMHASSAATPSTHHITAATATSATATKHLSLWKPTSTNTSTSTMVSVRPSFPTAAGGGGGGSPSSLSSSPRASPRLVSPPASSACTTLRLMKIVLAVVLGALVSVSLLYSTTYMLYDDDFGDGTVKSLASVHGKGDTNARAEQTRNFILFEAMERLRNTTGREEETDDKPPYPVSSQNKSDSSNHLETVVGEFSCTAYVVVHYQLDKKMKTDPEYCWTHYKTKGYERKISIAIETADGRFFEGTFSPTEYFRLNNINQQQQQGVTKPLSAWEHYVDVGYTAGMRVTITNPREVVLPGGEMEIGQFLPRKRHAKPRVLLLTHAWGGGTETFEDQLTQLPMFDFVFARVRYQGTRSISVALMTNSTRTRYLTEWFEVSTASISKVFDSIDYDLMVIHFLHPYVEMLQYLKTLNKPMVYIMHDHHLIAFDHNNDMHLTCSVTDTFNITNYKQTGQLSNGDFRDRMAGTSYNHVSHYSSWKVWRWEAAELLRRCVSVVTPSARNKQLFSIFFPEVYVSSAPLVRPHMAVCDVPTVVTPFQKGDILRVVILGAVSIGKGARIAERVAYEGTIHNSIKLYHIGGGFHYTAQAFTRVISKGRYNDTAHALKLIDEVNPHLIWFPAIRHESFCFMLDVALYSKYPIAASTTGSFPERISGRPDTWLLDGCVGYEEWMDFFNAYRAHPPTTDLQRHASVIKVRPGSSVRFLDHYAKSSGGMCAPPAYDFYSMSTFFESLRGFFDSYKRSIPGSPPPLRQGLVSSIPRVRGTLRDEGNTDEWMEFLALNPRVIFEKGSVEQAKEQAMRVLYGSWDGYENVNRFSLNPIFFKDRNHYPANPLVGPPYSDKVSADGSVNGIHFNKLQWISPTSLLVVWEFLAKHLSIYKEWHKIAYPLIDKSRESQPSLVGTMSSTTSPWAVPFDGFKHTKAAVMLDPRYSEVGFAVAMNVMYHLDAGWSLYIYCGAEAAAQYRDEFKGFAAVSIMEIADEQLHSMYKVSKWLMDADLWKQLRKVGVEHALVFQADSILFRGHGVARPETLPVVAGAVMPVLHSVNEYIAAGFAFIGAYGPGVGSDNRTPKGVGLNGGLSLRNVAALLDCLERVPFNAVNQYREAAGMEAVPHDPKKGVYIPEDIYYYHALEILGYRLPTIDDANNFAVQSAFHLPPGSGALMTDSQSDAAKQRANIGRLFSTGPLGMHGFDKGWYLSTAQLVALLHDGQ